MRVLQLGPYPPPHGGVQTNLVDIRSFLLRRGVPCAVINVTRHRRPDADEVYYPKGPAQLLSLLARLKYDVIHQHFGGMLTKRILALSLACTSRPGAKSVMTFHSGGYPSTPEGQALRPNSFAGFVLRRFDGLIGVNAEIMTFFEKMLIAPQRARLISPYSSLIEQPDGSLPEPLAAFFATHDPVLTSAGQLEPEYDLALQIEALSHVRKKFPHAGLVMLGSGSLQDELRAKIQAQPCAEHILMPGDVAHAATMQAMSRARILLRTTLYDGDAISVREALQLGTAVIATNNAMRPEGVILIPKQDLPALLRAIEQELTQPARPREVSRGDESNLQAVFDFYQELLAGKKN
jgi:glycosyltransferase involved in cell wall biosynthesis